jgi:dihydroorotase-like cyclic amidohydrolase
MAELGAIAFKLFTHAPPPHRLREFDGLWAADEVAIYQSLDALAPTGLVCTVHAENESLLRWFASGPAADHVPPRPPVIEATAIGMVAAIAGAVDARVHIAHLTSIQALDALRGAQAAGTRITAETCPQYLIFDDHEVARLGAFAKVAPPLRPVEHQQALWAALIEGLLSIVASDHAPFLPHEKEAVAYALAPQGIPTVETMLPILLDAAARGVIALERAVELVTSAPARLFGIYPRKGTVAVGSDADVVVFDPEDVWEVGVQSLVSRAAGCGRVYEGLRLQGRVEQTIAGGRTVFRNGMIPEGAGGRFIAPAGVTAERTR